MTAKYLDLISSRRNEQNYRKLTVQNQNGIDFYSNDYLGISRKFEKNLFFDNTFYGSTGSRLISGNSKEANDCEQIISSFFKAEKALVFNSGYDANLGLMSSLPQKGETIIYDENIHASLRDGIRLSFARSFSFKHNDLEDLENKIKQTNSVIYLVVESIYSMDGDLAPLKEIISLIENKNIHLIVDEAHSVGIYGKNGEGLCVELGIENHVFARVVTFGKAYGFYGAAILGSADLNDFLVNFCRTFIYTTALPPKFYAILSKIISSSFKNEIQLLNENIRYYKEKFKVSNDTAIQTIKTNDLNQLIIISKRLTENNILQKTIFSPTVPKGEERIRICLHAFNTKEEIDLLHKFVFNF